MASIPRTPLILSLAGLLPFIWSALTVLSPELALWASRAIGPRFIGPFVGLFYGAIILSFMSGVIWGFATKMSGPSATAGYVLSVIPALWVFFSHGGGPESAGTSLMFGFVGILLIDWTFWRNEIAPPWWMQLRVMITAIVLICLGVGRFA